MVADSLRPLDFMCKIDLRDAYFAVPIHQVHQKLLWFHFRNVTYQFKCLLSHFSTLGLHKNAEAPDSLCQETGSKDMYLPRRHANPKFSEGWSYERSLMLHLLENLRFIVNMEKSTLFLSHEMEFLGVLVSFIHMSFSLLESKVLNPWNDYRRLNSRTASQSDLAPLVHQGVPLHQKVILDIEAILDLEQWVTNLATANTRPVKPLLPDLLIQLDASGTGWGAVRNRIEIRGTWSLYESSLHINCLELLAATYTIKAFIKSLSNAHVLIQMDNTSAIANVNKMGEAKQGVLEKHACSLWEWYLMRNITL